MLSKNEFVAKHKAKFAGLSKHDITTRYADYERTFAESRATRVVARRDDSNRGATIVVRDNVQRRKMSPQVSRVSSSLIREPSGAIAADAARAAIEKAYLEHDLMRAMLGPFDISEVPRIPDSNYAHTSTTMFKFNINLESDDQGGVAFFFRNSPWACYAASSKTSNVATAPGSASAYVSSFEFDSYSQRVARSTNLDMDMPNWTENAWMIPVLNAVLKRNGANRALQIQDLKDAAAFYGVAAAWRPVCGGAKFTYTGPKLTASGEVAVARWPGAYRAPTVNNTLLRMNIDSETVGATQVEFGPTFDTVQALPGAHVYAAVDGWTSLYAPSSRQAQLAWRPVKPIPCTTASTAGDFGIIQVSNSLATGTYVLPPPCVGDPSRAAALIDRVYSQNANTIEWSVASGVNPVGAGLLLYFQDGDLSLTAAQINQSTSDRCLDLLQSQHTTDMMDDDAGIIMIGAGLTPNTVVGTIEIVVGLEYLPDTRTIMFGAQSRGSAKGTAAQQSKTHAVAIHAANAAPSSLPGQRGPAEFVNAIVSGVESVASAIPRIGAAVSSAAPYVESLLAAIL